MFRNLIFKIKLYISNLKSRYSAYIVREYLHSRYPKSVIRLHSIANKKISQNRGFKTMYFVFHGDCSEKFRDEWLEYSIERNNELHKINSLVRGFLGFKFIDKDFKFQYPIIFNEKINTKNHVELIELGNNFRVIEENNPIIHTNIIGLFDELNDNLLPTITVTLLTEPSEDKVTIYSVENIFGKSKS